MNKKLTFLQKIFSITKNEQKTHKIVCILGIKIKVAQKKKEIKNTIDFWQDRVNKFGARAVYNLGYKQEELDNVDKMQNDLYFEILEKHLNENDKTALDFGCGCGRFEPLLSKLVDEVYAVDPIEDLIKLAPKFDNVKYQVLKNGKLKIKDNSIDLIFVSLTLGGIVKEKDLNVAINELKRVSSPSALFFIVENTEKSLKENNYWTSRSLDDYRNLFSFVDLNLEKSYIDINQEVSILTGRKKQ